MNENKKAILKELGRNIRAERARAGLSQEELAEKIGLSYGQAVGTIERGEVNSSIVVLINILNALDIDFDKLIDRNKFKIIKS